MRLLVLLQSNPFIYSSAQNNRFLSLAEGLLACGATIKLIFIERSGSNIERQLFTRKGTYEGFDYEYIYPFKHNNLIYRKLFKLFSQPNEIAKKIFRECSRESYEYLWFGASKNSIRIALNFIPLKPNIKILHERSEFSWIGFSSKKKLHDNYLQKFLPEIDLMVVMTKTLCGYYKQFLSNRASLVHIPMTVDLSRFSNENSKNISQRAYIGYCGIMSNKKDGVDILIKAFVEIMNDFPDLYLYLAGSKIPQKDYLGQVDFITRNKATDRIFYLGNLSREEIPSFLSNATILALARPESKQAEGGFPTKLGEYLASGRPVCITDVGEIGTYLVDNKSAFFAKPGCEISFSNTLKRCLQSPGASTVGIEGSKIAFNVFNKDVQAKRLYGFLNSNTGL